MGTRKRRRLDVLLLVAAAVLVGVAALIGALVGDDERIPGMWAGARVAGGGAAEVVEVID
jgi:hypothetical protein